MSLEDILAGLAPTAQKILKRDHNAAEAVFMAAEISAAVIHARHRILAARHVRNPEIEGMPQSILEKIQIDVRSIPGRCRAARAYRD